VRFRFRILSWIAASLLIAIPALHAEITLPSVLADHMVIQRDKPVHVWGSADPGEKVIVTFRDHHAATSADTLGRWSLYLPPGSAGGPFGLTIQGQNTITFPDVLVGDLWIASGQSNMEMPLMKTGGFRGVQNSEQEIAAAHYPRLRLFHAHIASSDYPMQDITAKTWTPCTPQSVEDFSAVAYFFGQELLEKEKVPIGLIETDWGGTPAEAWTSLGALSDSSLTPVFAARAHMMRDEPTELLQQKSEERQQAEASAAGKPPINFPWHPDPNSWAPGALFNAMIAPFTPLGIRGVIWYQGESNTGDDRAPIYLKLFQTMISDWRTHWAQGNFPFLFVQIASYNSPGDGWPRVRDAQRRTLALTNTGMAVTTDIGDPNNVHPQDKLDVGHRLALWARVLSYGEHVEDSGPLFRQAVPEGSSMRIWFDHASGDLTAKGAELRGFEVAGTDGNFVHATAKVDGDTVLVSAATVAAPAYVRYGWAADPECNLYNGTGLPASPFTSHP
jgi:sialate O-acetylesterase